MRAHLLVLLAFLAGCGAPAPRDEAGLKGGAPAGDTIAAVVTELQELFVDGWHHELHFAPNPALSLVKSYVRASYGDDQAESFTYEEDAARFTADEMVAGTVRFSVARREVLAGVKYVATRDSLTRAQADALAVKAKALVSRIYSLDAAFGFDGWAQNGCAAPTSYLLVLDPADGSVYGTDLNPCRE